MLPIDRTQLALVQQNQIPSKTFGSAPNKGSLLEAYNTIDELYGYVNQTLQGIYDSDKFTKLGILTVKDFGAKGDGTTDDTTAINMASSIANSNGGGTVYLPKGRYKLSAKIKVYPNVYFIGAGYRNTILIQTTSDAVFECSGFPSSRTQTIIIKGIGIEPSGLGVPLNLDGASYLIMEDIECIGDTVNPYNHDGLTFNVTDTFNGWVEIKNCFIKGFKNNIYGVCNVLRIIGGSVSKSLKYGINIQSGITVTIDGIDISNGGVGGAYLNADVVNVVNFYCENPPNRVTGLFSPNVIEFGSSTKIANSSVGRWNVAENIVHGSQEDRFIDFNGGAIGNNHNSPYGLVANGNFEFLDSSSAPYGFDYTASTIFSSIPDPANTPSGHGNGIRMGRATGSPVIKQTLVKLADVAKYKGRIITATMYARASGTFTDSATRVGILVGATMGASSKFISVSNAPNIWIKYTVRYTVLGTETSDICIGFQKETSASNYLDVCGVSAVMGELNFEAHEKAITSAGGEIWSQDFKIGGKRHGWGAAAPTTGTWNQGDFVYNTSPVEAGTSGSKYVVTGFVCVANGTPGTWLQMRSLTGN